jgi:transposase
MLSMFIDISRVKSKSGKTYTRALLRIGYREDGKVKHRTMGNLSKCSDKEIDAIRFALKNKDRLPDILSRGGKSEYSSRQGASVGSVYTVYEIAKRLGIVHALGSDRNGKLALWQVLARVIDQGSRLSAVRLATSHAACDVLGIDTPFTEDHLYNNLDWLYENQNRIEDRLFKRRYPENKPQLFLYDVTSSYLEGLYNELAAFGYNRDGKKGKKQIVIGLLCDEKGIPLSTEVFKGNTVDVKTMPEQIKKVSQRFGGTEVTFVGDRGMIKTSIIDELEKQEGFHYITALTAPQIKTLMKNDIIQLSLFDQHLVEVSDQEENIRYILRRNPVRAKEITLSRQGKLSTVKTLVENKNLYLQQHPKAQVDISARDITTKIKQLKLDTWLSVSSQNRTLTLTTSEDLLAETSKLDGCYVIKTDLKKEIADTQTVHDRYKDLAQVEWAFRTSKTFELEMRPINVRKEKRTRGHILVVMLAYMIVKELGRLWTMVDLTVEEAINELSTLCLTEMCDNGVAVCNLIPAPRESVRRLLDDAKVVLPPILPNNGVIVATRKKLPENRQQ